MLEAPGWCLAERTRTGSLYDCPSCHSGCEGCCLSAIPFHGNRSRQYPKLSEAEIKTLVVEDKWLAAIAADIYSEMDRISQALTQRVKELAERYETPLPMLTGKVAELSAKVTVHLKKMGFQP